MGRTPDTFRAPDLLPYLLDRDTGGRLLVAFSGGADSTALLLALHEVRAHLSGPIEAVHVNHGVHEDADRWASHCRSFCAARDLPLTVIPPPERGFPPGSPEERLRAWRHAVLEGMLAAGDTLLMAHHQQDQAETLLLALLRGSGPAGLAAMPVCRAFGEGQLLRPLLEVPPEALRAWLETRETGWVEDPSNEDTALDRNFLRREVLPRLRKRWPRADRSIARSASLCSEAAHQLGDASALALAGREPTPGVLDLHGLGTRRTALKSVLRYWLRNHRTPSLPRARLETLLDQLETATPDGRIRVEWAGHDLRHHRGRLWLDPPVDQPCPSVGHWDARTPLDLGEVSGHLAIVPAGPSSSGSDPGMGELAVAPRRGGERFRAAAGGPSRSLKKLLNELALPPWLRASLPLLHADGELVAVGDRVLDGAFQEYLLSGGRDLRWTPANAGLAWAWRECSASPQGVK